MAAGDQSGTGRAGRSFGLILAAIAATGWGFAFYAGLGGIERETASRDRISALEERKSALADELAAIHAAHGRLTDIEKQIDDARDALLQTLEDRRDLEASLAALQGDIARLGRDEGAATPVSAGAANQGVSAAAVNAALARLDRLIDERSGQLQAIRVARNEAQSRLTAAQEAIDEAQTARARDEDAADEARASLSRLIGDLEQFEALIARREAQAQELAGEIARAQAQLATLRAEQSRLREAAPAPAATSPDPGEPERRPDGTRVIRINPGAR
jgi:septal ring factor EnvC (AmiA/AmiB activator)